MLVFQVMEAQGLLLGTNASLSVCKIELSVICVEVPGVLLGDALMLLLTNIVQRHIDGELCRNNHYKI